MAVYAVVLIAAFFAGRSFLRQFTSTGDGGCASCPKVPPKKSKKGI